MKQCWIRRRYLVKRTGSICAKIVNGEGREYTTCLHSNGSHSCDCKAGERGVLCYHVKHLRAKEAERLGAERLGEHVKKSAPTVVKTNRAETGRKAPVPAQTGKVARSASKRWRRLSWIA